jgi:hypothetical protein
MINLQQYHLEEALVHRAAELGADLRWKYKVVVCSRWPTAPASASKRPTAPSRSTPTG